MSVTLTDGALVLGAPRYLDGQVAASTVATSIAHSDSGMLERAVSDAALREVLVQHLGMGSPLTVGECSWQGERMSCELRDETNDPSYLQPTEGWVQLERVSWGTWVATGWEPLTYG